MHFHFYKQTSSSLIIYTKMRTLTKTFHFHPSNFSHTSTTIHLLFHSQPNPSSSLLHFKRAFSIHNAHNNSTLSPEVKTIVDSLVSVFTQKSVSGDSDGALTPGQFGSKLTPEIVENVLKSIRNWKVAYRFFSWAKTQQGFFHNCYSFNAMASILSTVRQNAPLKALAFEVVDSRCFMTPGALGFLIRCLGSVGLVEDAVLVFDQVRELGLCVPNSYSYNCLLEAIAKSGHSSGRSSLSLIQLVEMRYNEMCSLGWMVDRYTLTPILQVYCNAGEFEKALSVFNHMLEMGWVDGHILSILVLSFSKWGKVEKALELIERMRHCNVTLNEKTYCVLIHGFVSSARVDMALHLFSKMKGSGLVPDIAVYDVLIGGLCKSNGPEKALYLYTEMKRSGLSPDVGILAKLIASVSNEEMMAQFLDESGEGLENGSVRLLFNSVLNGLVKCGLVDRAYNLVQTMMETNTQHQSRIERFFKLKGVVCLDSNSYSIVIDSLCRCRRLDSAMGLLRRIGKISCEKKTLLYNNVIDALSNAERLVDCLDVLSEMKSSGLQPTHFTHNSIYRYFCRKGDVGGAMSMVKEMKLYRHEPWIKNSTALVKQLCKRGSAVEASSFLNEMVKEGFVPHLIPYSAALDGFFKLKEVNHALELFHNIASRGYRPDVVACNILINGLCKANRMSQAQDILNGMLAGGLVPSIVTYNSLIDGWCKNENIDQALVCFSRMVGEDKEPNVITYTTLIDGLCNARRPDDAVKIWHEMEGKACTPNNIAFLALINGLCKNQLPESALFYLHEMKRYELKADSFVYVALLDSFLLNNNPASALDMLKEMIDKKMFPDPGDKNHAVLKDGISKLSDDPVTSGTVHTLLSEGGIPSSFCLGEQSGS